MHSEQEAWETTDIVSVEVPRIAADHLDRAREIDSGMAEKTTWVTCLSLLMLSVSCAPADRSGADCLNEAVATLGAGTATKITVTCNVGEPMMLVGMPPQDRASAEPSPDQVPKQISALIRQSRSDGSNWCVFPSGQLTALTSGKETGSLNWVCRRVLATFQKYVVTTGSSLEVTLAKGAAGQVDILSVTGRDQ
jgi:hypothetical protein